MTDTARAVHVPLKTVAREWTKIGVTGFGGPPTHIALFRALLVERRRWLDARELEDAIAACNLLPGPASTQLAIFCAQRLSGRLGAVVGGLGFIVPAVAMVTVLAAVFLAQTAPAWIRGAGAGAGAAVAAVAAHAATDLIKPSWGRVTEARARRARWSLYFVLGAAAALLEPYLVLVLLGCGLFELLLHTRSRISEALTIGPFAAVPAVGGLGALAWVATKVGALSYGGGFVIVPLMRGDAVHTYHWMTQAQFLSAVALGQITPGPVVATVAAVGYAADGVGGALLAATIAFLPSFAFVMLLGGQFERLRTNGRAQAFLNGAGPAAIGAILGAAIALAAALSETWQFVVLGAAAFALLIAKRGVVSTLLAAGTTGAIVGLAGGPLPH